MQHALNYFTYPTPHGPITLGATKRGICAVALGEVRMEGAKRASDTTNAAATQLQEYLAGKRQAFDVPLDLQGSSFQKAVWVQTCAIPYGETRSAAELAHELGMPGAHRSVGTAVRRNPVPLLVPTHRVELPNATGKLARVFGALRSLEAAHATRG